VKLLGLLRHAKSDWDDIDLKDFDRGLNGRGRKGARLMGKHIADYGVNWERAVASPAERVKLTLEASALKLDIAWEQQVYEAASTTLMQVLNELEGDPASVLLVGHNPGLHELLFALVPAEAEDALFEEATEKFPTAAFAVLECDIERWSELGPGIARIIHFARPRDLDPELGPERVG
jgi:phosphohistidine phosphatase